MDRTEMLSKNVVLALAVVSVVLAACGSATEATPTTTVPREPTSAPAPAWSPTSLPAPSPTQTTLPSVEEVLLQYDREVRPLVDRLEAAETAPSDLELPSLTECQITLVPLSERLYYVQTILFPNWGLGEAERGATLYVTYEYTRGSMLFMGGMIGARSTKEVIVRASLVAELDEGLYLVEEREATGGEGCANIEQMVRQAVQPFEALAGEARVVEESLEGIAGYAVGADVLDSRGIPERVILLRWALSSSHWSDRSEAARSLGEIGPHEGVVAALIQALWDQNKEVRWMAAWALGEIGPKEGVMSPLMEALRDESWEVRQGAAWALAQIGPEASEAVPALAQAALEDEAAPVRESAVWALGEIGPPETVVSVLIQALEDESPLVLRSAMSALRGMRPQAAEAVPALIQILEHEDRLVRHGAAEALRWIGPEAIEAVPALIDALGDEESLVRGAAAQALAAITGQDFGEDADAWQGWWESQQ